MIVNALAEVMAPTMPDRHRRYTWPEPTPSALGAHAPPIRSNPLSYLRRQCGDEGTHQRSQRRRSTEQPLEEPVELALRDRHSRRVDDVARTRSDELGAAATSVLRQQRSQRCGEKRPQLDSYGVWRHLLAVDEFARSAQYVHVHWPLWGLVVEVELLVSRGEQYVIESC